MDFALNGKPLTLEDLRGKVVLLDFWAVWCPPCRALNPVIESLARDFKVCKVNVDTNQPLARYYGIGSIPALLIFKDGGIAFRHVGVTPEATLRAELEGLRAEALSAAAG